uniref:GB1/RHD3-type G domain-containing protein n=1 Tax=Alexandrium monilatum TaxID=311494 RepID=A0A7S4W4V0_9DINO
MRGAMEPAQEPPPATGPPSTEEATVLDEGADFDEPLHLLRPSEDHRSLVANAAAMQRLHALGPVTVLSVVGNQRGGKSTLMNLLHSRRLRGFQTGHYMDPQTHGLWVWPKPHPRRPGLTVLLVDSEGLDSPHVPQHYNWLISAVTLLMSDVYMYQTKGSIEQSSAERLDMILKVAEQLGKAGGSAGPESGAFLWLLRDHQLQMKNSPKQELIEKLDPAQVRALSRSFGDFDCVPLPRPASDSVLRQMDQHGWQDLDGDFKEEFVVLERRLLEQLAKPRRLFEQELTGSALAEVLRQYLAAIAQRKGALADICEMPTQRQMLQQLAGRRALDAGAKKYEERLAEAGLRGQGCKLPVRPAELLAGHDAASEAAVEALEAEALAAGLEAEEVSIFRDKLEERLALWDMRLQLAGGPAGLAGAEEDAGGEAGLMLEAGSCQRPTPTIAKAPCLKGGLFFDLWKENARRSLAGYHRWLQRVSGLGDGALKTFKSSTVETREVGTALESFYSELHEALAEMQGDEAGRLGPWAPLLQAPGGSSSELGQVLMSAARQGDGLVLALSEAALAERARALKEQLSEQCRVLAADAEAAAADLRARLEAATAEFARLSAGLAKTEEKSLQTTAELKEATAQAEARACTKAVELAAAQLEEGLQGLREEVREALRNLKAALSREIQERHAAQDQRATEAANRSTEAVQAAEQRARDASASLREALESQAARSREDVAELRRALEAAEARLAESLRVAEASLREQQHRSQEAGDARAEARTAELQAGMERLQGREEEAARRCTAELSELRGRAEASAARLEAAGASLESLRSALDGLQARISELEGGSRGRGAALEALEARISELEGGSRGRGAALEALEEKLSDASTRLQERLSQASSEFEERLTQHVARAEDRHSEAHALAAAAEAAAGRTGKRAVEEAEQLRGSLKALERQWSAELDARCPSLEAHCQEAAERLLGERLRHTVQECEAEEAQRLERRLAPMIHELAGLTEAVEEASEERQRQAELNASQDFPTLWESMAHLASRITDMQEVVDNLSLKGAGLMGS